jgi:hypothetical protein
MTSEERGSEKCEPWFECVTLDDVALDVKDVVVNGRVVQRQFASTIAGRPVNSIKHAELRSICIKLSVPAYKNKKKEDMALLIAAKKQNESIYDTVQSCSSGCKAPVKEIQCPFRLLNILFSDEFAESFADLGHPLTRQELDAPVSRDTLFWQAVQARFVDGSVADVGRLQFSHPQLDNQNIDPSKIVPHDWRALRGIYEKTRVAFKAARGRITSGRHEDNFFNYCAGRLDALYLYLHTVARPVLAEVVEAELPVNAFVDSESHGVKRRRDSECSSASSATETPMKRQKNNVALIVDAVNKFVEQSSHTAHSDQRAAFYAKRDAREEARAVREREHHEQQSSLLRFQEWERLSDRIRLLQRELKCEDDPAVRADIEGDIAILKSRKNSMNF